MEMLRSARKWEVHVYQPAGEVLLCGTRGDAAAQVVAAGVTRPLKICRAGAMRMSVARRAR
jgi:hypothetical protein